MAEPGAEGTCVTATLLPARSSDVGDLCVARIGSRGAKGEASKSFGAGIDVQALHQVEMNYDVRRGVASG
jgi:hypothetical protein